MTKSTTWPLGRFRILAGLTLVLIGLGSFVRATGAGLSCPDWPLCFGRAVPEFTYGVAQEVIHRYIAGVVMLLTLSLVWSGYRRRKYSRQLLRVSSALFVLICVQAIFGGLTVTMKLNPFVVTTHLALGTLFLQSTVLAAFPKKYGVTKKNDGFRAVLLSLVVLTYAQILLGGFVGASGASLSCDGFPLCDGKFLPGQLSGAQVVQLTHRLIGFFLVFFFLLAAFLGRSLSEPMKKASRRMLYRTTILVAVQIAIGWYNLHLMISPLVTVLHILIAQGILTHIALLWWRAAPAAIEQGASNRNNNVVALKAA